MAAPIAAIIEACKQAAEATSQAVTYYLQGKAQSYEDKGLASTYDTNATINDLATARQAAYVNEAGASQVHNLREQSQQAEGSIRAAMAAQGMDSGSGSARAVLSSTERAFREDEALLRATAEQQAFEINKQGALESANLRSQAKQARISAKMAKAQSKYNILSTILTGSAQVGGTIFQGLQNQK